MSDARPTRPIYEIRGWDAGDDNFIISVRASGYRIRISVAAQDFIDSPLAYRRFRQILDKLAIGEDHDDEVWEYMYSGKITLAEIQPRGAFDAKYCVVKGTPSTEKFMRRVMDLAPQDAWDMRSLQTVFPIFDVSEVVIHLSEPCSPDEIIPREVYIRDKLVFYKACWSPHDAISEVAKYSKLVTSNHTPEELLTSRLFGIVAHSNGQAKGLLYDWIATGRETTLTSAINIGPPISLRKKWASQIRDTVSKLHKLDIIWGDVKPDNVLIDENDNAIVIDFEGGTTRDWVDRELVDSIEGDLQGLKRLEGFILDCPGNVRYN